MRNGRTQLRLGFAEDFRGSVEQAPPGQGFRARRRNFVAETKVARGVLDATMVPDDSIEADAPTCKKCGQTLALIGSVPALDGRPRTRILKCIPCQLVIRIPPIETGQA